MAGTCNAREQNKFSFSKSQVQAGISVPMDLVQTTVDENEIRNRIIHFIKMKRVESDQNNSNDYSYMENLTNIEGTLKSFIFTDTCARVNHTFAKQESSKCHLKVFRVKNHTGPQARRNYIKALDKLITQEKTGKSRNILTPACKRLEAIEQYLSCTSNQYLSINVRLKEVEDRILRLESISPEYYHFSLNTSTFINTYNKGISNKDHKIIKYHGNHI